MRLELAEYDEAAEVVWQALDKLLNEGVITKKTLWQAIELWAADSLGGA